MIIFRILLWVFVIGTVVFYGSFVEAQNEEMLKQQKLDKTTLKASYESGQIERKVSLSENLPAGSINERSASDIPACSTTRNVDYDKVGKGSDMDLSLVPSSAHRSEDLSGRKFLVATLDGRVTLLDQNGVEAWSINTGELFTSTISSQQLTENGKYISLIPSLTGTLYKYDEENILPMPVNVDNLLQKSFKISNDVMISGGKELRTFGVNLKTGKLRYECGMSGCSTPQFAELEDDNNQHTTLIIKKQLQTVRATEAHSGVEKWNFSVGTHELGIAGADEECYEEESRSELKNGYIKVIIPEGRLLGADPENKVLWDKKFDSPISQTWMLENGKLIYVDPIKNTPIEDAPLALYVGKHNQQFYVQESKSLSDKIEKVLLNQSVAKNPHKVASLQISWKPSLHAIACDVEDAGTGASGGPSTALSPLIPKSSLQKPFYVIDVLSNEEPVDLVTNGKLPGPPVVKLSTPLPDSEVILDNVNEENLDTIEIINEVVIGSLWFWWKEILGISLLTAVILNILLMKPLMRYVRLETMQNTVRLLREWFQREKVQDGQSLQLVPLVEQPALSLCGPHEMKIEITTRSRTISDSLNSNAIQYEESPVPIKYMSQYLREFEPVQCLGKGGFGVVFEAKKKIDDRHYAVKRIALPNREQARDRVMREVKALAQLDHRNIVRYFNAWIENPPNGWLENNDPLWPQCTGNSVSPTTEHAWASSPFGSTSYSASTAPYQKSEALHLISEEENDSFICFKETSDKENQSEFYLSSSVTTNKEVLSSSGKGFWVRPTSNADLEEEGSLWSNNKDQVLIESEVSNVNGICTTDEGVEVGEEAKETGNCSIMYLYIQQELCQKRTLREWLRLEQSRGLLTVLNFFGQIVEAVEYVHSKSLIHRDLKPSNIFLSGNIGDLTLKIGDFGLATTALRDMAGQNSSITNSLPSSEDFQIDRNLTSQVGTQLYMSPEQSKKKPYSYKVDIYSLGLIFFELLVPFTTEMERHEILSRLRKLRIPTKFKEKYPEECEWIQDMISHNPDRRPDAHSISQWVKSHIRNLEAAFCDNHTFTTHRSNSSPSSFRLNSTSQEKLRGMTKSLSTNSM